jgi:hypothetical protein
MRAACAPARRCRHAPMSGAAVARAPGAAAGAPADDVPTACSASSCARAAPMHCSTRARRWWSDACSGVPVYGIAVPAQLTPCASAVGANASRTASASQWPTPPAAAVPVAARARCTVHATSARRRALGAPPAKKKRTESPSARGATARRGARGVAAAAVSSVTASTDASCMLVEEERGDWEMPVYRIFLPVDRWMLTRTAPTHSTHPPLVTASAPGWRRQRRCRRQASSKARRSGAAGSSLDGALYACRRSTGLRSAGDAWSQPKPASAALRRRCSECARLIHG